MTCTVTLKWPIVKYKIKKNKIDQVGQNTYVNCATMIIFSLENNYFVLFSSQPMQASVYSISNKSFISYYQSSILTLKKQQNKSCVLLNLVYIL